MVPCAYAATLCKGLARKVLYPLIPLITRAPFAHIVDDVIKLSITPANSSNFAIVPHPVAGF